MPISGGEAQQTLSSNFFISRLSLFILFSFELISGIFLSFLYRSGSAYQTTAALHQGPLSFIQGFHYWASSLLIVFSLLLVVLDVWAGRYGKDFRLVFTATAIVFFSSLGFQLTGNLLPFDRHGAGTATIEAAIAARIPIGGDLVRQTILGGAEFSPRTVEIWYGLHLAITAAAIAGLTLAYIGLKPQKSSQLLVRAGSILGLPILISIFVRSPFGSKATAADYSDFSDKSSWYTQPLHGALVMTSKLGPSLGWIGAILIPTVCGVSLLLVPWVFPNLSKILARAGTVIALLFFCSASLFFGGSFDPLTGTRDPMESASGSSSSVTPVDENLVRAGRAVFNSTATGCGTCHGVDGIKGGAGPSLTNTYQRHPDADYYMRYVKNPQSIDPNSTMPAFPDLTKLQLQQIGEYLRSPKKQ